ncbi:YbdK family carboxylate-amine ligase [Aeromicrobium yanjiei]|uniref:Putative glutamate--cysteine ligase 2 n=1 Tax=Aeromicrobium yanjiei TaxID=2662028 RepID=A0A5Q2MCI5_9ACTN|nr:YbdK family carboxylate-amine ligase [Aeromicrobium yanjiei]
MPIRTVPAVVLGTRGPFSRLSLDAIVQVPLSARLNRDRPQGCCSRPGRFAVPAQHRHDGAVTVRKVAVEEEMFLVDPGTRQLVASSHRAVEQAPGDEVEQELFLQQVETQSDPHHALGDVIADLKEARRGAAKAADGAGARLAAMPTPVMPDDEGRLTPKRRYEQMMARFGRVGREALACGMHVHVDIADDEEGVAVLDRIRPWLPLVQAVSTGSPFDLGIDTSYASWRAEIWDSWPSAGPVEPFGDAAGYEKAVEAIVASGAALDHGMLYFDARLARDYPTVEIRVADICTDLADTALVAALSRGLVETCAEAWHARTPLTPWRVDLLRAARWQARRHGVSASLLHPLDGALVPAADALGALVDAIGPALERAGDRELVEDGIARVLAEGTGADRQRAAAGPDLDLRAVVDDVLESTAASHRD